MILQMMNVFLPLVTYPYLIRVLGKEIYGLIVFAQAIVSYLVVFVNFGFNISATKEVSVHREDKEKLSEIVSSVLIIKGLVFIFIFVLLIIAIKIIPKAYDIRYLLYLSMWLSFSAFIFPIWYFQGIEKMKYITFINFISRVFFILFVFLLIHSSKDYLLVPAINGAGAIISGFISVYIVIFFHKIKFNFQPIRTLKKYIKISLPLVTSDIFSNIYVNTNKLIVGTFLGMAEVSYYDLADRVVRLINIPITMIGQTIFPKIEAEKNVRFALKMLKNT